MDPTKGVFTKDLTKGIVHRGAKIFQLVKMNENKSELK